MRAALAGGGAAVLQAPPGAGKTTRVPIALLDESWLRGGRIIMLEPRRIAARAAAHFLAESLGEEPGERVGYRIRRETRVSRRTRIEVVTEGVLTRMLQADPGLDGTGLVIFDEFHERNLHADLGLALTLETRAVLREDLRVLVMSATLDGASIAAILGGAPIVTTEGRSWPVETRWRPLRAGRRHAEAVAAVAREALDEAEGDVLVFLPGVGEIARVQALLADPPAAADVVPLHGSLPGPEQDRALRPAGARRRIIVATNVAETSLTIDGVRTVVDGGLARVPRYSPRTGMTRLTTVRVSRDSADQRRGRAGRQAPGVCYRLWAAAEDHHLLAHSTPEILEADLTPLALELAVTGQSSPDGLAWLDPPPAAAFRVARALLKQLGALDESEKVTPHGRQMAALGVHPRLAHLLLRGRELGHGALAADLAALLAERDLLGRAGDRHAGLDHGAGDADLRSRIHALRSGDPRADRALLQRVRQEARHFRRALGAPDDESPDEAEIGLLLALAYPDRVARRRGDSPRYILRNGQGAFLVPQALAREEWLACADLDGEPRESRIRLAAPISESEVRAQFADQLEATEETAFDASGGQVITRRVERLGAIVLREVAVRDGDPDARARVLLERIRAEGLAALPWGEPGLALRQRLAFLHRVDHGWPDVSEAVLLARAEEWLGGLLADERRLADIEPTQLSEALLGLLDWRQRAALDTAAPSHLRVPSGSRIAVDYSNSERPVLAVPVQEVFGWSETPRLAGGRVPVTLELLSPARRPVQVTRDLAGFWRTGWAEVRKEMRGRYPKHDWPENPASAVPSRRPPQRR
ncbi:MAG: ATP-dependent helicase HrpB [Gemmatimonadales bacterium]